MTATHLLILAASPAGRGGIQRLTQEVIATAERLLGGGGVTVLSLGGPGDPDLSEHTSRDRLMAKGRYTARALMTTRDGPTALLCLHAGLSPLARGLACRSRARYAVACYGLEVWGAMPTPRRWGLRGAHELWSISDFTSTQLVAQGVEPSRIRAWPLGLTPGIAVTAAGRGPRSHSAHVLSVARLTRRNAYKGVDALLAAWPAITRAVPHATLRIVGDGDMRPGLERLACLLGVGDSVTFLGSIDDASLNKEYAKADLFALPGRTRVGGVPEGEGFGIAFLEAAAAGLPSIGGRGGGAPEAIIDQKTGVLVDPLDIADIAASVVRLLVDPALAADLGASGSEWVRTERSTVRARQHLSALLSNFLADA